MANTVFDCTGCKYYRHNRNDSGRFCHYALDEGKCRVIKGQIVPAEKCFTKKIFFAEERGR